MAAPAPDPASSRDGRRSVIVVGAGVALLLAALVLFWAHENGIRRQLLVMDPDQVTSHPDLVRWSLHAAKPVYASHCAACHGAQMQGDPAKGAPNLRDSIWLYGDGGVGDIERTVLYGIRSGNAKSHNITDMPPLGRNMQISPADTADVTAFVLNLSHPTQDPAAVARGSQVFQGKGVCYDCHSGDARGNPDYGAPDLTDNDWLWGGGRDTVYRSIYSGRHGRCPAWIGKLSAAKIRALAVYLNQVSHHGR